jgi:hypothetical protein
MLRTSQSATVLRMKRAGDFLVADFLADGPHATSRGQDCSEIWDEDDTLVVGLAVPEEQPSLIELSDERRHRPKV